VKQSQPYYPFCPIYAPVPFITRRSPSGRWKSLGSGSCSAGCRG
jgi:hypothetical protein